MYDAVLGVVKNFWGGVNMKKQKTGGAWYLLLRCSACQNIRGYRAPKTNKAQTCKACGAQIPLANLTKIHVWCECGRTWNYRTNLTGRLEEFPCIDCGSPLTVERDKLGNYESVT